MPVPWVWFIIIIFFPGAFPFTRGLPLCFVFSIWLGCGLPLGWGLWVLAQMSFVILSIRRFFGRRTRGSKWRAVLATEFFLLRWTWLYHVMHASLISFMIGVTPSLLQTSSFIAWSRRVSPSDHQTIFISMAWIPPCIGRLGTWQSYRSSPWGILAFSCHTGPQWPVSTCNHAALILAWASGMVLPSDVTRDPRIFNWILLFKSWPSMLMVPSVWRPHSNYYYYFFFGLSLSWSRHTCIRSWSTRLVSFASATSSVYRRVRGCTDCIIIIVIIILLIYININLSCNSL